VTKATAEDLCQLFHRNHGLACIVLRTSRFFPEEDDNKGVREAYSDDNVKANEYLYRRVDMEDVVSAHLLASRHTPAIGFGKYIVSEPHPFCGKTCRICGSRRRSSCDDAFRITKRNISAGGGNMFPSIGRVYVNDRARKELGWQPRYDFHYIVGRLRAGDDLRSPLARSLDRKDTIPRHFPTGRTR
jgi:nucleoside-diphosphate-sugar epimerase